MSILFVVNKPKNWPLHIPGVEVVDARAYLADPEFSQIRKAKVFNLCRSYRYQTTGYYVSLLAEARGHRPIPSILTIQDMRTQTLLRVVSEDLEDLIQKSLASVRPNEFTLSIYFGRNVAKKYDRLSLRLFNLFQAPLLRAHFVKHRSGWQLQTIGPIGVSDIPESHRPLVVEYAKEFFGGRRTRVRRPATYRYDLAILHNPDELNAPSDKRALDRFTRAAENLGLGVDFITKNDYARLSEYDALFIRETTAVNHHTYRFARRASAEGIVVIDDPESIIKCSNKVYLAELLTRHRIPVPKTQVIDRERAPEFVASIPLPCVLKEPDSSFSMGVIKVETPEALTAALADMFERSELVIAQEFIPTEFDWRVGIVDRRPLYVCRYYMARHHWQIIKRDRIGRLHEGNADTLAVEDAPATVVRTALRAANLIGDGFYGVDLKQVGRRCVVMEVNDNPSIDGGVEDEVLKEELYDTVMRTFLTRIERSKKNGKS